MKISKLSILIYFIKLRFSRIFRSNKISKSMKKSWIKTLYSSPYYSDLLKNNQKFPTMQKELFMEYFDSINTVGIKKEVALKLAFESEKTRDFSPSINNISIGLSSGTSGNRGIFLTSKIEKAIWVAAILDRVIGFSLKKRNVAFFLRANNNLYQAVKSGLLSFTFFDLKTPTEEHMKKLMDLKADILVGQPSVLLAIAKSYQLADIKPTFNKIISVAEVLEDDHKKFFKSIFNCPINQVYQCTEGFLGYTCKKGQLHLNEDFLKIKKNYLDSNKNRFHPVITDYLRSSQPIVRYELNDILHEGPVCSCGSKSTVISKIEGRSDDIFRFLKNGKEIIIYPDFIRRAVILASDQILNYSVTLIDKQIISLYLDVKETSELPEIFKSVKFEIEKLFSEFDIGNIDFVKANKTLDQLTKFTRIKNENSKSF